MNTFKASLKKVTNTGTPDLNYDNLLTFSDQASILKACNEAQLSAVSDIYHTSKVCLDSLKLTQVTEKTLLIPFMLRFPPNSSVLSVGAKISYVKETISQFISIIEHFAEEANIIHQSLALTDHVISSTSEVQCDFTDVDCKEMIFDDSFYEEINISHTSSEPSEDTICEAVPNPFTPPASPLPEHVKSQTKPKAAGSDAKRRNLPGSQTTNRTRK